MSKVIIAGIAQLVLGLIALSFSFGGMVVVAYFILLAGRS